MNSSTDCLIPRRGDAFYNAYPVWKAGTMVTTKFSKRVFLNFAWTVPDSFRLDRVNALMRAMGYQLIPQKVDQVA
jgi:hypothetical protein